MKRQREMEDAMLNAHRQFVSSLEKGLELLEQEIAEAGAMSTICTDEWCKSTDHYIDELHKDVYAISEPRWAAREDSARLKDLRRRVKDLYAKFRSLQQ